MPDIDQDRLFHRLIQLLAIPSPTGMTDAKADWVVDCLQDMSISAEKTNMGAVRARIEGTGGTRARAFSAHIDTLGAMVSGIRANGRPTLMPIGTWAARFAEGARAEVFCRDGKRYCGTIMPLKSAGHRYSTEIDTQPSSWENLELRLDAATHSPQESREMGIASGDWVAVDPQTEITDTGYVVSRFLDNAAAVAALLEAAQTLRAPPCDIHLVFPAREEIGTGANHLVAPDVAEFVALDLAPLAPDQAGLERGVTVAMMDASGPFDRALSLEAVKTCEATGIPVATDVFRYYRSDALAALNAGADIATALMCYGCDGSHGWERVHKDSIIALTKAIHAMMMRA